MMLAQFNLGMRSRLCLAMLAGGTLAAPVFAQSSAPDQDGRQRVVISMPDGRRVEHWVSPALADLLGHRSITSVGGGGSGGGGSVGMISGSIKISAPAGSGQRAVSLFPSLPDEDLFEGEDEDEPQTEWSPDSNGGGGTGSGSNFEWTRVEPSFDSRKVYVSSTLGKDTNSGLSEDKPLKTIEKAKQLMRHGYPDWLMLKAGDTFSGLGNWNISGRSAKEPCVVTSYGSGPRPRLSGDCVFITCNLYPDTRPTLDHFYMIGLEMVDETRDPDSPKYTGPHAGQGGVQFVHKGENILIEDCVIRNFNGGIGLTGMGGPLKNVRLRGTLVLDNYCISGTAAGMYVTNTHGLLIEGCVFDSNGHHPKVPGALPSMFNHNIYIDDVSGYGVTKDVVVRNNVSSRAAATGLQLRPGGVIERNLFISNPMAAVIGGKNSIVRYNMIVDPTDILPDQKRGWGLDVVTCENLIISKNIFAHKRPEIGDGPAIVIKDNAEWKNNQFGYSLNSFNVTISENVVYDWNGMMVRSDTSKLDSLNIVGNRLQAGQWQSPCVALSTATAAKQLKIANNEYFSKLNKDQWFHVFEPYTMMDLTKWSAKVNDEGSSANKLEFAEADRTPAVYANQMGNGAGYADFIHQMRQQSKASWQNQYATPEVLRWVFRGYRSLDALAGASDQ